MAEFTPEEILEMIPTGEFLTFEDLSGADLRGVDRYGESGTLAELYQAYQLDAKSILSACRSS
jgi:pyruvate dehydrogenase complex dehydrogenase (E1) component